MTEAAGAPGVCRIPAGLGYLAPVAFDDLVRIGPPQDGGYVVPRSAIERADMLVSLGVSDDWSFEAGCRERNPGLVIHAYDHTVSRTVFLRKLVFALIRLPLGKARLGDVRKALRTLTGYGRFFDGERTRHFRQRVHNRIDRPGDATIERIFNRFEGAAILSVDIEGAEYRIIDALAAHRDRAPLLLVEFHDTDPLRPVFETGVKTLLVHYEIVHLHANNWGGVAEDGLPEVLEFTFLRRDLCQADAPRRQRLPLDGLDAANNPRRPDFALEFPDPGAATRP